MNKTLYLAETMTKKKVKRTKIYYVRWYLSSGWNYRDTSECTWKDVLDCKRQAKLLGERIEYELDYIREDTYWL